jgi:hypothetical protein
MDITLRSSDASPITTATDTIAVPAPGANKYIAVVYIFATNAGATATKVAWRDGVAGALRFLDYLPQGKPFGHRFGEPLRDSIERIDKLGPIVCGRWKLTANTALYINTNAAGEVHWTVEYVLLDDYGHEV